MEKENLESFYNDYLRCKNDFEILFRKLPPKRIFLEFLNILPDYASKEFNSFNTKIINSLLIDEFIKYLSEYYIDLVIFDLFMEEIEPSLMLLEILTNENTLTRTGRFKKNYIDCKDYLKQNYSFVIANYQNNPISTTSSLLNRKFVKTEFFDNFEYSDSSKNQDLIEISQEIFSFLAERPYAITTKMKQIDSGTYFTPKNEIEFIVTNALIQYIIQNSNLNQEIIINIISDAINGYPNQNSIDQKYAPEENISLYNDENIKEIIEILSRCTILDPACGSGKFLITSFEYLQKIYRLGKDYSINLYDFSMQEKILSQLYGMDVNPSIYHKCKIHLILTMLSYLKLKNGKGYVHQPKRLKNVILKMFSSKNIILGDTINPRNFNEFDGDSCENNAVLNQRFSIIIGNPPFVRQENIKPIGISLLKLLYQNVDNPVQKYKKTIVKHQTTYMHDYLINKRSDLYVYFFLKCLNLLQVDGVFGLISSNSWLNVGFGFEIQKLFLEKYQLNLISNRNLKAFNDVKINTVITFLSKRILNSSEFSKHIMKFLHFQESYQKFSPNSKIKLLKDLYLPDFDKSASPSLDLFSDAKTHNSIMETLDENYKIRYVSQKRLMEFGMNFYDLSKIKVGVSGDQENLVKYTGCRWENVFLTAPNCYFHLIPYFGDKLIPLNQIASISRGITTGNNKYFIFQESNAENKYMPEKINKTSIQENYIEVVNGFGDVFRLDKSYLTALLDTPKILNSPVLKPNQLNKYVLHVPKSFKIDDFNENSIHEYIKYGEDLEYKLSKGKNKTKIVKGINNVPSLKNKKNWFSIAINSDILDGDFYFQKIYDIAYKFCVVNNDGDIPEILPLNNFYCIKLKNIYKPYKRFLTASFLSSLTPLFIEISARRTFGRGALDTATFDLGNIFVLNPFSFSDVEIDVIIKNTDCILQRDFEPIFEEIESLDKQILDKSIISALKIKSIDLYQEKLYEGIRRLVILRQKKAI